MLVNIAYTSIKFVYENNMLWKKTLKERAFNATKGYQTTLDKANEEGE